MQSAQIEYRDGTPTNGIINESYGHMNNVATNLRPQLNGIDSQVCTKVVQCLEQEKGLFANLELCDDNSFVIENKALLDTNRIQESLPEGHRIIDISNNGSDESLLPQLHNTIDSKVTTKIVQCIDKQKDTFKNVKICEDDSFVINNKGLLDTNRIQESLPEGRRIVDISFMWNEIHRIFDN